jgi:cell division protein ZapB
MVSLFPVEVDVDGAPATLENDLAALERKLAALINHTRTLRAANESLRRELASAQMRNRGLSERVVEAKARIDALLARLPEEAQ